MSGDFNPTTIEAIQDLYEVNDSARRLFDWTAGLKRDASFTTVERVTLVLGISRSAAVSLFKDLEGAGCGEFVVGRRGSSSRFAWSVSRVSLGQVAIGESDKIESVQPPLAEEGEEEEIDAHQPVGSISISDAKALLASSLGLKPEQIEIQIKA